MSKRAALLLIAVLTLSSLIMVESAFAQSIPKPSIPEFTVKFVDNSYDVPPTYGIDQFTGKNVTIEVGYHIQNKTIELAIKNQPFSSYKDASGNTIRLYYSIRMKGNFGNSWGYPDYSSYEEVDNTGARVNYVGAYLDSEYTLMTYGLVGNNGTLGLLNLDISAGGQADFQVQAFIGYKTRVNDTYVPGIPVNDPTDPIPHHYVFTGETSGWSNTQTITIPASASSSSSSSSPTSTPDQTTEPTPKETLQTLQVEAILGTVIAVAVVGAGLLFYFKKRKR
jgi:hypothetical protein